MVGRSANLRSMTFLMQLHANSVVMKLDSMRDKCGASGIEGLSFSSQGP